MEIKNNILTAYFKNAYFITGTPCAGKSTMCKLLAQRYGLVLCGENYTLDQALQIVTPEDQPNLNYFHTKKDWQEYLSRTPEEYKNWFFGNNVESSGFEIAELLHIARNQKVIVDTNIPLEILKETSDYNHIAVMLSPQDKALKHFFNRSDPEKRFLLEQIKNCPDPEWTLKNFRNCIAAVYSPEYYAQLETSGFFTTYRKDFSVDTKEETLHQLAKHFGFSNSVIRLTPDSPFWNETICLAETCSWENVGKHLADMMIRKMFTDWESVFACLVHDRVVGFCTFLKTDFYPENRYSPWISTIFVNEEHRGNRLSEKMIEAAIDYARQWHFTKVYIPSDIVGLYEKYGFRRIDALTNYAGDTDLIFERDV